MTAMSIHPAAEIPLTVTGLSAPDKVYDGTTATTWSGTPALQGVPVGQNVTLVTTGLSGAFADKTVGNNKLVTFYGLPSPVLMPTNIPSSHPPILPISPPRTSPSVA